MQRNAETLTTVIQDFLKRNSLYCENPPWEIQKSPLGGFGVFATRPIEIGEVIFKDNPVILGPRAALTCPSTCVSCYENKNLVPCKKLCGLPVCSEACQNSSVHQKECKIIRQWRTSPITSEELSSKLCKVLTPIRSLLLSDKDKTVVKFLKAHKSNQHGFEVDVMKNDLNLNLKDEEEAFMRFVCCVMDSNAFEVIVGNEGNQSSVKGLYPLGSLANHSCIPNSMHVFDENKRMIVRAASFIRKNEEIFHSYSRLIWSTPARRFHLFRTKHFLCKCERCEDPTEFGTYMSAILCKICKRGLVVPIEPLTLNSKWQCDGCGEIVWKRDVAMVTSLLGSALNSFTEEDLTCMLRFLERKLLTLVPENNEVVLELKYKIIWMLGYQQGLKWSELPDALLSTKEKFCKDLLTLLETLRLGQCKMRGLLLYELYCTLEEMTRREERSEIAAKKLGSDLKNLLDEAANILMYDVSAPNEIKKFWTSNGS